MDRFRSLKCGKCATTPPFDRLARLATEPKVIVQSPSALAKSSPTRRMRVLVTWPDTDRPLLVLYKSSSHSRRDKLCRQATPRGMVRGRPSWRIADIRPICRFGLSFRVQTTRINQRKDINPVQRQHFWEPSHSNTV